MIDMHCHLDLYPDPFFVAKQCDQKSLYILSVTTTPSAWQGTSKLANQKNRISTALGLHPQLAHERHHELELFDSLLPNTKYVGEIGLDGGRGYIDHMSVQLHVFKHILRRVTEHGGRIMSIHSRGAAKSVLDELENADGIPILHWFTGGKRDLQRAIDMGCWFSVGPAMLGTKKGQNLVSIMPRDRVLTESDGPFAKINNHPIMPWDTYIAITQLSNIWKEPEDEIKIRLLHNLKYLVSSN